MEKKRLEILQDILKIDSTNGNEEAVADYLKGVLEESGIIAKKVAYADKRTNLIAEIGAGAKTLAISGHMDVVSAGNLADWTTPPFEPTIRDGKLFARGATDMKSGLAALVCAMAELSLEKVPLKGKLKLLATVGEEVGLLGAHQLTNEGYADGVDALIIGEPSGHLIVYAHKGVLTFTVNSVGKSAHSSMPELGVNAIDNLLVFYTAMQEAFSKLTANNPALGKFVYNNSIINGGKQANSVPDEAFLMVNTRTTPEVPNEIIQKTLEKIVKTLNDTIPTMDLSLEINQSTLPVFSNIDSKLVTIAKEEGDKMFNEDLQLIGAPGGTDAAEFIRANKDMQIIIFGPGNDSLHQTDEYVKVDNYLEMVDLYKKIIIRYFEEA
ncbi:N-succinyl-diaminopimelate deacylase [Erysipelotrichaceae bacterium]|nr:N-succinyl-diaminopimelate deacylase [Erysipelotrichaceae bacterium]